MSYHVRFHPFCLALSVVVGWLGSAVSLPRLHEQQAVEADPLPSWNAGTTKKAILDFVARTTRPGSPDHIPIDGRIAVFDNDGTLWPENPMPFEVAFSLDQAKKLLAERSELKEQPAYKAVAAGDVTALTADHLKLLRQIVVDTHSGQTAGEFSHAVKDWFSTARHPRFKRPYADCTYLPMQEVLSYLRANGYKTYIVSGGSADFMRVFAEKTYGIPPEQVIGTVFKTKYELVGDKPTITILPELAHFDDKAGKPVAIYHFIGRQPVMCFGNSDGDHEMLQYTTIGEARRFGLLVHHTDEKREYAYDSHPKSSGKLVEALAAAKERGWIVVNMQADWKQVFTPAK
ncbi:MAG: HAD family hydrolase [Pirellulales bacterium]